jgi:hypothetical protein
MAKATPRRFTSGKDTVPIVQKAGSGRMRKISPSPGFNPRIVQPVASRYTDWAIQTSPKLNDSSRLGFVEIARVAWHASFQPLEQENTCNSVHEQTPLSNDTIDSVLRHWEIGRATDLTEPSHKNNGKQNFNSTLQGSEGGPLYKTTLSDWEYLFVNVCQIRCFFPFHLKKKRRNPLRIKNVDEVQDNKIFFDFIKICYSIKFSIYTSSLSFLEHFTHKSGLLSPT